MADIDILNARLQEDIEDVEDIKDKIEEVALNKSIDITYGTDTPLTLLMKIDNGTIGPESIIADAYDNTQTYSVGDVVIYDNTLYKCIVPVTIAENFDDNKWAITAVDELLNGRVPQDDLAVHYISSFDKITSDMLDKMYILKRNEYLDTATYNLRDIITYQNKFYECTTPVTTPANWDTNKSSFTELYNGLYEIKHYQIRVMNGATGSSTFNADGTIASADSRYYVSDYLDVFPEYWNNYVNDLITNGITMYGCFYDIDKTFISSFSYSYSSRKYGRLTTITDIPSTARFVRFSYDIGGQSKHITYYTACFICESAPNYLFVRSNDLSLPTQNDTKVSELARTKGLGSLITLDTTNAIITVGKGVENIKVTAITEFYQNCADTRFSNVVKVNGANTADESSVAWQSSTNQGGYTIITNVLTIGVLTGDQISFVVKSSGSDPSSPDYLKKQHSKFIVEMIR